MPDAVHNRVDYGWDGSSFDRQKKALHLIRQDPSLTRSRIGPGALRQASLTADGTSLRDTILAGSATLVEQSGAVHDVPPLDTASSMFTANQIIHSWVQRHLRPNPIPLAGDPDLGLNQTQTRAVAMALASRLSLVQGPPGTGKTAVIVALVKLLKVFFQVPVSIAVCAPTNIAVDNLVVGMAEEGLKPVRIGDSLRIGRAARQFSLDSLEVGHALTPRIQEESISAERLVADLDALEHRWRQQVHLKAESSLSKRQILVETLKSESRIKWLASCSRAWTSSQGSTESGCIDFVD